MKRLDREQTRPDQATLLVVLSQGEGGGAAAAAACTIITVSLHHLCDGWGFDDGQGRGSEWSGCGLDQRESALERYSGQHQMTTFGDDK